MSHEPLFTALSIGATDTPNRIFMAPMTRARASAEGVPREIMAEYYAQRADAGLIISEATAISAQGVGWVNAPGIFNAAQEAAWRPVTDAVHAAGGRIFLQLWHMGRVSHPDFQPDGALPVGPSAIAATGEAVTPEGRKPYVTPRALETEELAGIVADYRAAAARAVAAGFDGVEIHAANGYLMDQFIRDGSNQREDAYGGSLENRWRLPLEVTRAIADEIGADRTAIRLSPVTKYNGMSDSDPVATFAHGAAQLDALGLAFVHVLEPCAGGMYDPNAPVVHPAIRAALPNTPLVLNGGYDAAAATAAIVEGRADAIAFGVPFLVNPDLVTRIREGITDSNAPDFATFYTNGPEGYTDYPTLDR